MPKILTRFITPKRAKLFDPNIFVQEFRNSFSDEEREILKDFRGTVFGWSNKPTFKTRFTQKSNRMTMFVFPAGASIGKGGLSAKEQYLMVNRGRKGGKIIVPKGPWPLKFQSNYRASTRPNSISSRRNFRSGPFVRKPFIKQGGYEGRDFFGQIGKLHKPEWKRHTENAIRRAITRSR